MLDNYKREISYLRISVTDRCNLRCTYCMPASGIKMLDHKDILSFEEITQIVEEAVKLGITKVRLTGGEPLVRKGIVHLVSMINNVKGVDDLSMTTNGILLPLYAARLKSAGLKRINISLDSLNNDTIKQITRCGSLDEILAGISSAKQAGLSPIKINAVKLNQNEEEHKKLEVFCRNNHFELRYIQQMNLKEGTFGIVEGGIGGNCKICNRIRLTANGKIKPCLLSDQEYDIRELGIKKALETTIQNKPQCGSTSNINEFYNVGG